jgi:NADPH:quinone reductase-like Zn-dependent oxidoreductase
VICDGTGGPEIMSWGETATPRPAAAGDVLVRVTATAVNRADLAQREGRYPVPPGASPILGLECSGIVAEVSAGVPTIGVGDPVMALVTGGAYAEFVAAPAEQIMPASKSIPLADAGALPETLCVDALADDGTALVIGLPGGSQAEIDLSGRMRRRLSLRGSTLRARPADQKRDIVAGTVRDLLPLVERGEIRPIIDQRHRIDRVADAHAYVGAGRDFGKVLPNVRSNSQP